jgi:hypothetical protein
MMKESLMQPAIPSQGAIMIKARTFAVLFATLAAGVALTFNTAHAQKMSAADKTAAKQATVSCKAEAKGKKVPLLQRRKYVKECLVQALKDRPNVNIDSLMKTISTRELPQTKVDAHM